MPTLPNGSIRVEHVWKKFRADRTAPLFYDQILRMRRSLSKSVRKDYRWVLKDINLEVEPGGTLGLIGINGSGKTTLLKIISKVTYQSAGVCQVQGRLGALLSVTSGIHPDLTGRENVYLYGTVLGMRRKMTRDRFDQIVEFAGLEDAIDRQVKFFSLGMQMRLGFSIAAFLEPDILLVDEVLAVGDANFQQKCIRRIEEVVRQGTTLVYVSHDLNRSRPPASRRYGWPTPWCRRRAPPGKWLPSTGRRSRRTPRWPPPTMASSACSRQPSPARTGARSCRWRTPKSE